MTGRQADQGVRRCIMTRGTTIMNLVVERIYKGRRRTRMTDCTRGLNTYITGNRMVNTVIYIRHLRSMTRRTRYTAAGGDYTLYRRLHRGCITVVRIAVTRCTVTEMLYIDICPGYQVVAAVIMTDCTTLLRWLRGIHTGIVRYVMSMNMAGKVVRGMTLAAITSRSCRGVRRAVVTGGTCIMLLIVSRINEVCIIHRLGMTRITLSLQRYLRCVILRRMCCKVAGYTAMTLRTVAGRSCRGVGRGVMTGAARIMLQIISRIYKVCIIHRCTMTAYTTGMTRYLRGMILGCMRCKVTDYTTVTLVTIAGRSYRQLRSSIMTHVTAVMLQTIRCIYKGTVIHRRTMTARATCMLGYLTGVILGMRCPVARYTAVTQ